MSVSILLCAEGKHDFGVPNHWNSKEKKQVSIEGWMQPLVRKLIDDEIEFEVKSRRELLSISGKPKVASGHGEKAYQAKRSAVLEGCDFIIFMVDADSVDQGRVTSICAEILAGFRAFKDNNVGCVVCVPMSASESWMLADETAWSSLLGSPVSGLPNRPEEIWGNPRVKSGNHPHQYFARICSATGIADNRETRNDLARYTNLEQLRQHCSFSFPPFEHMLKYPDYA